MTAPPAATHVATFTVQGEPRSKARPRFSTRNGRVVAYTPRDTKTAEDRYRVAYLQAARAIETDPFAAFTVEATFYCGTKQRRDVDNMLKAVLDGLNKTAWPDDAQVVEVVGRKTYVPKSEARSEVTVRKVGELNMPIAQGSQPRKVPAGAMNRGNQKVTEADVRAIREKFNDGVPRKDIAAEYGISVSSVASIGHRRTWKSVA